MFCPQCGTESGSGLQYCRSCGANLKVIGKAVSLSEAIARSDRGPLPKIKEMMKNLKMEQVSEDISRALEQMNKEIVSSSNNLAPIKFGGLQGKEHKSATERREKHFATGTISIFSGIGLAIFLYFLSGVLVLKLPPDFIAKVPFEIEPVVPMLWLLGVMPVLSGVGHILGGFLIKPDPPAQIEAARHERVNSADTEPLLTTAPGSITERTTNLLEHKTGAGRDS